MLVRKSLARLIEDAAAVRGIAVKWENSRDGRLGLRLVGGDWFGELDWMTPGAAADVLGVVWTLEGAF